MRSSSATTTLTRPRGRSEPLDGLDCSSRPRARSAVAGGASRRVVGQRRRCPARLSTRTGAAIRSPGGSWSGWPGERRWPTRRRLAQSWGRGRWSCAARRRSGPPRGNGIVRSARGYDGADMPAARSPSPLSGRRAEAARNDEKILAAAREVFITDPTAPITAVAKRAGVGISALYSRYGSKDELLRTLCHDGLAVFVAETEAALADERPDWEAFSDYMARLVDADTSSMTLALAGTFTPTEEMFALAERANTLLVTFFERVRHV